MVAFRKACKEQDRAIVLEAAKESNLLSMLNRSHSDPWQLDSVRTALLEWDYAVHRGMISPTEVKLLTCKAQDQAYGGHLTSLEAMILARATPPHMRHPSMHKVPYLPTCELPAARWAPLQRRHPLPLEHSMIHSRCPALQLRGTEPKSGQAVEALRL